MKALTLTQPHATLVCIGAKHIETRSWGTSFRGRLAIHAAKGFPQRARSLCQLEPFRTMLLRGKYFRLDTDLPLGMVIATCRLVNLVRFGAMPVWIDPSGQEQICEHHSVPGWLRISPFGDTDEFALGDYSMGRYAWLLTDVQPLPIPIPAKGALGLWEWDEQGEK